MSRQRKMTRLILAAIPLAYHILYRKNYGNRRRSDRMELLPRIIIPENDFYLSEDVYGEKMDQTVLPYLEEREERECFETEHRISYAYYRADVPRATVVISHGFGESISRYSEPVYYFLKMGYDVFIPEHFGHGDSDSGVSDRTWIWVDDFDTYTKDFHFFIHEVVRKKNPLLPLIIYAHSMGGTIAAGCMEEYPDICDAAILSAPMLQIFLLVPESLAYPLASTLSKTAMQKVYFLGERQTKKLMQGTFEITRTSTHSAARGRYMHKRRINAPDPPRWVVTWGWAHAAIKATHDIVRKENVRKIRVPLLMFQAGTDFFVNPRGMYEFAAHAGDLQFYKVPGSFHEIYTEKDSILIPYFNKIHQFIEKIISSF